MGMILSGNRRDFCGGLHTGWGAQVIHGQGVVPRCFLGGAGVRTGGSKVSHIDYIPPGPRVKGKIMSKTCLVVECLRLPSPVGRGRASGVVMVEKTNNADMPLCVLRIKPSSMQFVQQLCKWIRW